MIEGVGLKPWERRAVLGMSLLSTLWLCVATVLAWLAVGPHWLILGYGTGAALAWAALRADRASRDRGASGSRLRRVLGWIVAWEIRFVVVGATLLASLLILAAFRFSIIDVLVVGLADAEMTKAQVIAAAEEAYRQTKAEAEPWIVALGVSGVATALLSGLTDWLWLGALSARHGVSPWRVLSMGWSRRHWRQASRRQRMRWRRLLEGEASE